MKLKITGITVRKREDQILSIFPESTILNEIGCSKVCLRFSRMMQ